MGFRTAFKNIAIVLVSTLLLEAISYGDAYHVRLGDTLTEILLRKFGGHVYGKSGYLVQILKFNPQIKNPDHLKPGEIIYFDSATTQQVTQQRESEPVPRRELATEIKPEHQTPPNSLPMATESKPFVAQIPTPTPTPLPEARTCEVEAHDSFKRHGSFSVEPFLYFSRIDSTDSINGGKGIFLSNLNSGAKFQWAQVWSDGFTSYIHFFASQENFEFNTSTQTLGTPVKSRTGIGIGGIKKISHSFWIGGELNSIQQLFPRSMSASNIQLDGIFIPEGRLYARYEIAQLDPFELSAILGARYLSATQTSTQSIQSGTGFDGTLEITEALSHGYQIIGQGFYSYISQNSSAVVQNRSDLGISLGIKLQLGDKTP